MYILESKTVFVEQPWRTPMFFCNMMFSVRFWVSVGAAQIPQEVKADTPRCSNTADWHTYKHKDMQGIFFSGKFLLPARIEPLVPRYTALSFRATEATTAKNNVSNKGWKFPKSFIYIYLFMLKHVSSTKFLGPCRNLPIDVIKFCCFGSAILTFWPNFLENL